MKVTTMSVAAALAASMLASPAVYAGRVISPEAANLELENKRLHREAVLKAEANASYLTRTDHRRLLTAQAMEKARREGELAQYEQFKFDQQVALAEASAPKIYMSGPSAAEELVPSGARMNSGVARPVSFRKTEFDRSLSSRSTYQARGVKGYPARFWAKQARERGADSQEQRYREEAANAAMAASVALPVSGQNGLFMNPNHGGYYIDARGYRSGDLVKDPYSGEVLRVP